MKYLCWIYDSGDPSILAGLEMYVPWWPDNARHGPDENWYATYNSISHFDSGQIWGHKRSSGYDMDCNVKMNGVYYGVLRIEKMFDSHTFSNSSGSGYIYASCHKKGFNDDGSGKRRITWKMGG